MKKNLANACSAIAVFLFFLPQPLLAETVPLTLGQPIVVPGTKGRFDYLEVDEKLNRLLAAHTTNKTLDIISLPDGKLIKSVSTGAVQGAVVDTDHNKYYASVSAEKKVAIIDRQTLEITGTVSLPGPADALAYNPKNGILVVLDSVSGKSVGSVDIAKGVDQIAFDPGNKRIYCASGQGHLTVLQETKEGVKSLGDVTTPAGTHTLAVDPNTHSVWIAFAKGEESYVAELKAK